MYAGRRSPRRLDAGRPPQMPGKMTSVRANSRRPISLDSRKPTTVITTPMLKKAAKVALIVLGSQSLYTSSIAGPPIDVTVPINPLASPALLSVIGVVMEIITAMATDEAMAYERASLFIARKATMPNTEYEAERTLHA